MEKYLTYRDVNAYKISFELSNYVWEIVMRWDGFAKRTIGSQFVNSTDSISANIAEGFGRHFKKEKVNFYRYSRGSAMEASDWNQKAQKRNLMTIGQYEHIKGELDKLPKEINNLIYYTSIKLKV